MIVAYRDERENARRGERQRRAEIVQALLADPQADAGGLGHELDGHHHLALVAWGDDAAAAVTALARELDRAPLLVEQAEGTWWAWLSGPRPLDRALARERLAAWRPPPGTRVALGGEQPGREGFRGSHREARDAHRAAVRRDEPVTRYADVALELLASADEAAARRFVAAELGALDDGRPGGRAVVLRETLAAWFATGHNAAATARALGVHEQTVVNRLRAVEQATGSPVASRRAELETALRLRRHLERRRADGVAALPSPPG
nr:helix-turn-helix domain-containing protein [Conexibacter arvalis]